MKSIKRNSHPLEADTFVGSSDADLVRLAGLIRAHTPHDGSFELRIPGVHAIRASRTNTELVHAVAQTGLVHRRARREESDAGAGGLSSTTRRV